MNWLNLFKTSYSLEYQLHFFVCYLLFAICYLLFAICYLLFAIRLTRETVMHRRCDSTFYAAAGQSAHQTFLQQETNDQWWHGSQCACGTNQTVIHRPTRRKIGDGDR
jgi:hypothetical protein